MIIKYGIRYNNIDVTSICIEKLCVDNIITIPSQDGNRTPFFGDPLFGTLKSIFIINGDSVTEYDSTKEVVINIQNEILLNTNKHILSQNPVNNYTVVTYGLKYDNIDVTDICIEKLRVDNIITIPSQDGNRTPFFGDPLFGTLKSIFIINGDSVTEYDSTKEVIIDLQNVNLLMTRHYISKLIPNPIPMIPSIQTHSQPIGRDDYKKPSQALQSIYNTLQIKGGKISGRDNIQIPQQNMIVKYLTGDEKVLEVGSNIGRNALVIAHILQKKHNNQFVAVECNKKHTYYLQLNKTLNNLNFYIEESAFSKKRVIQNASSNTIVSDRLLYGYNYVNIISYTDLIKKYNIDFNTLILDCDNMFYNILQDMPELLNKIKLIILTNNYNDISHKNFVSNYLKARSFTIISSENGIKENYYEVWKRVN